MLTSYTEVPTITANASRMPFALRHALPRLAALLTGVLLPVLASAAAWDGPTTGPTAQSGPREVTFIAQDFRNGGISGVYRAFSMAAAELGWKLRAVDGNGNPEVIRKLFAEALSKGSQGIVLGGFQAEDLGDALPRGGRTPVLVGWHAANAPGPTHQLFFNVSSDAVDVARMATNYVMQHHAGPVGAVIINDNRFDIANLKTRKMKSLLDGCAFCKTLEVMNVPINRAAQEMPELVRGLNQRFGKQWTHTLAINDIYFDEMNYPLMRSGRTDIRNVSAGDGSPKAISRIRSGQSQQAATVAEPLNLQGWQLADELNRAFAGKPPSGYVSKPILLDQAALLRIKGADIDADIPYKQAYRAIWQNGRTGQGLQ